MNPELREMLGKVAFEQSSFAVSSTWDNTSEELQEEYRKIAEAVAITLAEVALPALQSLAFAFIGKHVEMSFEKE